MSTQELTEHTSSTLSAIHFDVTAEQLQDMREQYLPLVVTDFDDRETIAAVVEGHKTVKKVRTQIESRRKSLNADALAWQRTVNSTAKDLTAAVQEVEDHLKAERDKVDAEKDRIKREKEAAAQAVLQDRVTSLAAVGGDVSDLLRLRIMSDEDFATMLTAATEAFAKAEIERRAEEKRLLEQEARLQAEKKRLEEGHAKASALMQQLSLYDVSKQLIELVDLSDDEADALLEDAKSKHQAAIAKKVAEEKAKAEADAARDAELAAQRAEIEKQQAELAELRKLQAEREAAEAARLAAEAEKQRQAEAAEAKRLADEERQKREAELQPLREQLRLFAATVEQLPIPDTLSDFRDRIFEVLDAAAGQIESLAD